MADFTVQIRAVLILDVEVEADTMEEALTLGKGWKLGELVTKLDPSTNTIDYSLVVAGVHSEKAWSTE